MKKLLKVIVILLISSYSYGQKKEVKRIPIEKSPNLKLSYISRITQTNPGLILGAEFMVRRKTVKRKSNLATKEKFITLNAIVFNEPDIYDNVALYAEWMKRVRYRQGGFFTETALGFGSGKGINYVSPPTYVKDANGLETIKDPKTNFIMVNLTSGIGYDFMPKKAKPIKAFARVGLSPILQNGWQYNVFLKTEIGLVTSTSIFKRKKSK